MNDQDTLRRQPLPDAATSGLAAADGVSPRSPLARFGCLSRKIGDEQAAAEARTRGLQLPLEAGHRPELTDAGYPVLVAEDRGSPSAEDGTAPIHVAGCRRYISRQPARQA
jgi:hypothetical protein